MKTTPILVAALAALAAAPSVAAAQRPRRQAPIEIRGQVPTPQVTTVRPREVPAYDRQVLVPDFYDHNFWQSILPAYQLVQARAITGATPNAATPAPGAMPGATPSSTTPPGAAPAAGTPPVTPPAGAPPATPASTTPGTAPATPPR